MNNSPIVRIVVFGRANKSHKHVPGTEYGSASDRKLSRLLYCLWISSLDRPTRTVLPQVHFYSNEMLCMVYLCCAPQIEQKCTCGSTPSTTWGVHLQTVQATLRLACACINAAVSFWSGPILLVFTARCCKNRKPKCGKHWTLQQ